MPSMLVGYSRLTVAWREELMGRGALGGEARGPRQSEGSRPGEERPRHPQRRIKVLVSLPWVRLGSANLRGQPQRAGSPAEWAIYLKTNKHEAVSFMQAGSCPRGTQPSGLPSKGNNSWIAASPPV